jgi:hypothetical protein
MRTERNMSQCLQEAMCKPGFIPVDKLHEIVTKDQVRQELRLACPAAPISVIDENASIICQNFSRIFAILALVGKVEAIESFIKEGVNDRTLPFVKVLDVDSVETLRPKTSPHASIPCFQKWPQSLVNKFEDYQWKILPAHFLADCSTPSQGLRFWSFDDKAVLPFLEDDYSTKVAGGFGEVWKVQMHRAHHKFVEACSHNTCRS